MKLSKRIFLGCFLFSGIFLSVCVSHAFYMHSYSIMPLGDSITQGHGETDDEGVLLHNSYRKPLYSLLSSEDYSFDFVGSMHHGSFSDNDHESYGGRTADLIESEIYGWLTSHYADIVLLHAGTNDISSGQTAEEIVDEVASILDEIDRYDSDIAVLVAQIINLRSDGSAARIATTSDLNTLIEEMVHERMLAGDKLYLVDQEAALDYSVETGDLFDLLHPTEQGYGKMADAWFPTLQVVMGAYNPPPLEAGEILVSSVWKHVDLEGNFTDPVVVVAPFSRVDDDPAVVRICNVTPNGFDVRLQEWDYLDGGHAFETLGYLVIERGSYQLESGTMMSADSFVSSHDFTFENVTFGEDFNLSPVVVASITTCNDGNVAVGRIRNISLSGFEYRMQEEESHSIPHLPETVSYIAWEPGNGKVHEIEFDVGSYFDTITHQVQACDFARTFTFSPVVLASMQTGNELDPASVRFQSKTNASIFLLLQEETSLDSEVAHIPETVGYIALSHKSLNPDPDGDGISSEEESAVYGTDPTLADTDMDGLDEGEEILYWSEHGSRWDMDSDEDGMINLLDSDSDDDGELDGIEVDQGSDPADAGSFAPVQTTLIFEVGEVILDHDWVHVAFKKMFADPVVILGSLTAYDESPAIVRIRNVTSTGFDVRVQEWDYEDWLHGNEITGYLVVEKGKYLLSDGTKIYADTFLTTGESVAQRVVMSDFLSEPPVVLACVNTENESDAIAGRVYNVGTCGFDYLLQEEERSTQEHESEVVGYVAWEPSVVSVNGTLFEIAKTDTVVTHEFHQISWTQSFIKEPGIVAAIQTMEGLDTAAVRQCNRSLTGVEIRIEEEASRDDEVFHLPEIMGYIVFSTNTGQGDQDDDGISDIDEIDIYGTDYLEKDTDHDGLDDGEEVLLWGEEGWGRDGDEDGLINLLDFDSDNDGDMDGLEIENMTDPEDPASVSEPLATPVFERGEVEVDTVWMHVEFTGVYSDPVVVAGPPSFEGTDPITVRIRNVTSLGFDIRVEEWDYLNGEHSSETIGYLVMERGKFLLDDGTRVCAGKYYATGGDFGQKISFAQPFNTLPVIVTCPNTVNESSTVSGRIVTIDVENFSYILQEQEANTQEHAEELISYIAWEPSSGSMNGTTFEIGRSSIAVTHDVYSIPFEKYFFQEPVILAGIQTIEGTDPVALRLHSKTVLGFAINVEEEQSDDFEVLHYPERVGYMIFGQNDASQDEDGDGLSNGDETEIYKTDPRLADTDVDGLDDGEEYTYWGEMWDEDIDNDGLINLLDADADGDGDLDGFEIEHSTDPADSESYTRPMTQVVFESGNLSVDHVWQHVSFVNAFADPVVVAGPLSYNGTDPATVRVCNVTSLGFDIRVHEWGYLDEIHALENVGYLVMEKGKYLLESGVKICAETFVTEQDGEGVAVEFPQVFTETPVIVACVITANDTSAVTGRVDGIDLMGFEYLLQEQESNDQLHGSETVSYIAWEPSLGSIDGVTFEIGKTSNVVTELFQPVGFESVAENVPVVLADMQGLAGYDTAGLRVRNVTQNGLEVRIDEEKSSDSEVGHAPEHVGYMAFFAE